MDIHEQLAQRQLLNPHLDQTFAFLRECKLLQCFVSLLQFATYFEVHLLILDVGRVVTKYCVSCSQLLAINQFWFDISIEFEASNSVT